MNHGIINDYLSGVSASEIARRENTYTQKIIDFLKRNNIEIRGYSQSNAKYDINSNFFERIDSHEKAYFLGWMYSDGNVYLGSKRNTLSITLVEDAILACAA